MAHRFCVKLSHGQWRRLAKGCATWRPTRQGRCVVEEIAEFSAAKTVFRRQKKTMLISLGFLKITTGEELGQITNCLSPTIES